MASAESFDILVVDDDEVDRAAVRRALRTAGVELRVTEATDAPEALATLAKRRFDCVLLDFRLPKSDGLSLLKEVRKRGVATPIVMLTGHGDEALAVEIMKGGAVDYLVKGGAMSAQRLIHSVLQAVRLGHAEQMAIEARNESDVHRHRLQSLFMQAPVAIAMFEGPGHLCVLANPIYRRMMGGRDFTGRPIRKAAPELDRTDYFEILDHVYETGETRVLPEQAVREGSFNTTWQATVDAAGKVYGVMVVCVEVTAELSARRALQGAVRSRDDLLATVSHDLRSPLSNITLAASQIQRKPEGDPQRTMRHAATIERAAGRMERLIRDLLDLDSIERGRFSIDLKTCDPKQLIGDALEAMRPMALEKGVRLEHRIGVSGAVGCDPDRIAQVFANLLGNAIKFTPQSGTVIVSAEVSEGRLRFSVCDTGPGIAAEDFPRVFDRFWQSKETARAGVGLGLAICRGIVEQHGGKIWLESSLGVGTTFFFDLPL